MRQATKFKIALDCTRKRTADLCGFKLMAGNWLELLSVKETEAQRASPFVQLVSRLPGVQRSNCDSIRSVLEFAATVFACDRCADDSACLIVYPVYSTNRAMCPSLQSTGVTYVNGRDPTKSMSFFRVNSMRALALPMDASLRKLGRLETAKAQ